MKFREIICSDCAKPHSRFIAEGVEFSNQPTVAPKQYPLAARYADFNRRFFGAKLPNIPLGFARMKGLGGKVTYQVMRPQKSVMNRVYGKNYGAALVPDTLKLTLSADFARPMGAFDAILLHEMVHVEMAVTGQFDENHGSAFIGRARAVTQASGIPVPAEKCPSDWFAVPVNTSVKRLGVILQRKKDGRHSFALVSEAVANASVEAVRAQFAYAIQNGYLDNVTLWTVADPAWSGLAMEVPVQRVIGPKMRFFIMQDETPLADLVRDGTMLLDLRESMNRAAQ